MRIAVTGAAGFIGSHLAERLVAEGHEVAGIDNFDDFYDPRQKQASLARLRDEASFVLEYGDIRDRVCVERVLNGCDAVVHLAARAGVRPSFALASLYADVNVTGTAVLLETAADLGVPRFVFGSSSSVYGEGAPVPFSEAGALGVAASPYAATKVAGEMLCRNFAARFSQVTILRFFTVYGPRQRPDLAIHKFARRILDERPIPIYGSLESFRDYTFVDDIVGGIVSALGVEEAWTVLNLGSGNPILLRDMIRHLEIALGQEARMEQLPPQVGDLFGTWADVSLAGEVVGYRPRWKFANGAQRFAEWFLQREAHHPASPRAAGAEV